MPTGTELIQAERTRQLLDEHFDAAHDDDHQSGELVNAARCYIMATRHPDLLHLGPAVDWPWDDDWWRPSDDPIRNLTKAGALIAAEIDRLQRAARKGLEDAVQEIASDDLEFFGPDKVGAE